MSSPSPSYYSNQPVTNSSGSILGIVMVILVLAVIVFAVLWVLRKQKKLHQEMLLNRKALKIMIPKIQNPEEERHEPKEVIDVMESLYSALHHFYVSNTKKDFWSGQPTFSFEIIAQKGQIAFYLVADESYIDSLERQIHSQYPSAHIERTVDHAIFQDDGEAAIGTVGLLKKSIFPIKTYKYLEYDPIGPITNALSKLGTGTAAFQVLIQPINQGWQKQIEESLQNIQQGKSFQSNKSKTLSLAQEVGRSALGTQSMTSSNEAQNTSQGNVRLTALQEQQAKLLVEKGSKVGFNTQIRCVAVAPTQIEAKNTVQNMLSSFSQFQAPESNGFKVSSLDNRKILVDYILRGFSKDQPTLLLNTEELTSVFHFPNYHLDTPNIEWLGARRLPPPNNLPKSGVLMGFSNFRGNQIPVYTNYEDRSRHLYMIGKTGVGKTTLFENMVVQDMRNGHGICYMDPNGDAIEWILNHVPKERAEDVILFDPSDTMRPMGLNLLEYDPHFPEQKSMVVNEVVSIFNKLYSSESMGPMFELYMRNAMLLVMADPESGSSLMEVPRVLADADFRKMKLSKCKDQIVINFWTQEAEKAGGDAALANIVPYITSKLNNFTTNDIMRPIIGQQKSAFNFREAMDNNKIILVNLPKGLLGEINSMLLGMIISGKIQIAAFSRQNQPEEDRVPFYFYVDEFQDFTSKTFATILSQARKYKLSLNITNQYIAQLDEDTRNAVIGNVGTLLSWRIGASDAEFMIKEFDPLKPEDLVNTEKHNYYIRMLIDGTPTTPFNVASYAPDPHENRQIGEAIKQLSRVKYGRDRELVESEIRLMSSTVPGPV